MGSRRPQSLDCGYGLEGRRISMTPTMDASSIIETTIEAIVLLELETVGGNERYSAARALSE